MLYMVGLIKGKLSFTFCCNLTTWCSCFCCVDPIWFWLPIKNKNRESGFKKNRESGKCILEGLFQFIPLLVHHFTPKQNKHVQKQAWYFWKWKRYSYRLHQHGTSIELGKIYMSAARARLRLETDHFSHGCTFWCLRTSWEVISGPGIPVHVGKLSPPREVCGVSSESYLLIWYSNFN